MTVCQNKKHCKTHHCTFGLLSAPKQLWRNAAWSLCRVKLRSSPPFHTLPTQTQQSVVSLRTLFSFVQLIYLSLAIVNCACMMINTILCLRILRESVNLLYFQTLHNVWVLEVRIYWGRVGIVCYSRYKVYTLWFTVHIHSVTIWHHLYICASTLHANN